VGLDSLNQHVLVSGVTGSGKTTTIQHILLRLLDQSPPVPFLVIEPTKSEYRTLWRRFPRGSQEQKINIYTLGDETVSPFRINPFQFEILDANHFTQPQTHIDYLKSVFSAAFVLYPPMPYVLEICLHEIYTDRGWNLSTNRNERLPVDLWDEANSWPIFPTFDDLYQKVEEVTDRLGYDDQIRMDVKAGLQTRLRSMMIGGKGVMMNIQLDPGMRNLLEVPSVLELERIGDDEQKVFLMGIILTRLFEYRRLENAKRKGAQNFAHLTVIEEAHRLLKADSPVLGPDQASSKGQAVETFANLISEIRAYGEGILISEQIPTKLAIDAIKNTNLKIMHRLVAKDDRDVLSAMTNMNDQQSRYMVTMPKGEAVVFKQGEDHPLLIKFMPDKFLLDKKVPSDKEIRNRIPRVFCVNEVGAYLKSISEGDARSRFSGSASEIYNDTEFVELWCADHLRLWMSSLDAWEITNRLLQKVRRDHNLYDDFGIGFLLDLMDRVSWFDSYNRGRLNSWNYNQIQSFSVMRMKLFYNRCLDQNSAFSNLLTDFLVLTKGLNHREVGPFEGCFACKTPCLYRFDLLPLVNRKSFMSQLKYESRDADSISEMAANWIGICTNELTDFLKQEALGQYPELTICVFSQALNRLNLSHYSQKQMMSQILNYL
jgi:hypothetical protein